ncbi:MAG: hypothetical protein U1F65_09440 [Verrucomicrobiota bacterium]
MAITPAALTSVPVDDICHAIDNHVCGIWGNVSAEARAENEHALLTDSPLLSVYHAPDGKEFRVLTTGDRFTTTVHLPSDSILNH